MLKILQARLQQYVNQELQDVHTGFRKGKGTRNQIANVHWIIKKQESSRKKKIYFCFIDYTKAFGRSKHRFPTTQEKTHGNHQMVNTEIRLIIFFAAKDGEALYSQQKQDRELTVAHIMNSLLPNSDLN